MCYTYKVVETRATTSLLKGGGKRLKRSERTKKERHDKAMFWIAVVSLIIQILQYIKSFIS